MPRKKERIDEDLELWRAYKEEGDRSALERIVEKYTPLVVQIAYSVYKNVPKSVSVDDLISSGNLGLMDAIEKYDPSKGVKFKSYAQNRIRGAILDELREVDWMSRTARKRVKEVQRAYTELERKLGRPATDEEVAQYLGISLRELRKRLEELNMVYLLSTSDVIYSTSEGEILREETIASSEYDPQRSAIKDSLHEELKKALAKLPENERLVIYLHHVEGLPHKHIAKVLGVSDSRVSQLYSKGLSRLRGYLEEFYSVWAQGEI